MARVPAATRESVPESQRDAYDQVIGERGGHPAGGPIAIMINVPEITKRGEHLRAYELGVTHDWALVLRVVAATPQDYEGKCEV